jgi:anaerobic magnesium-protoporphyrin IX monomethyl ester cyclase
MNPNSVVFVAFREFDNLGVGYLASVLAENGFNAVIVDLREGKDEILRIIQRNDPALIGFSIIFQYYINDFRDLVNFLRQSGVKCHFTAGGQYASMRYAGLFDTIPALDSIVRFEGEYTLLDLACNIRSGTGWETIKGLVFRKESKIIVNPLRPHETDLDRLPYPVRSPLREYALGEKYATLIAGRGCLNNCAFCNNSEYMRQSSVHTKRIRSPENVAGEIEFLYHEMNCSVFLFEDDDFPLSKDGGTEWIERFCTELGKKELTGKIMWKINCRPDEVTIKEFEMMKNHGLFLVFLGIDDGTDRGLSLLNKQMSIAESLSGIQILKNLSINFDYGFMLFQPSSTFSTVNENLQFLSLLCEDGGTPIVFLRLIPYFGTKIERDLEREGRLKGEPGFKSYDFYELSLNHYFDSVIDLFGDWLYHADGLVNVQKWARNYVAVYLNFHESTSEIYSLYSDIKAITTESNLYLLEMLKRLSGMFQASPPGFGTEDNIIKQYRKEVKEKHDEFIGQIIPKVRRICNIAEYQDLRRLTGQVSNILKH